MEAPVRIIVSGLTCAGKTTHSELLATHYGVPCVAMRPIMRAVIAERDPESRAAGQEWSPAVDEIRRREDEIDLESDRRMQAACDNGPGVFDAWALPWLSDRSDAVRVWIESDHASRVRKCVVSATMKDEAPPNNPQELVDEKDRFSREQFARLYNFELSPAGGLFDVVAENTNLIPQATVECARTGIACFQPYLVNLIDRVLATR